MLAKSAIQEFLQQANIKDSWEFMKKLPERELDEELQKLPADISLKGIEFTKEQKVSLLLGVSFPYWMFHLDMGLGKTIIALALVRWHMQQSGVRKVLVVVPNVVNIQGWCEEIARRMDVRSYGLIGNYNEKSKVLKEGSAGIYIINYHGLMTMMTKMKLVKKRKAPRQQNGRISKKAEEATTTVRKRKEDKEMCEQFVQHFQMLVLDETHFIKNHESLLFYLCDILAMNVDYRYGLTGTPFSEPKDLWSQFYAIDRGDTFGDSINMFLAAFYRKEVSYFGSEWVFDKRKKRVLTQFLRHRSIQYLESDVENKRAVRWDQPLVLSKEQQKAYEALLHKAHEAHEHPELDERENLYVQFREITAGYRSLRTLDPETGDEVKTYIHFPENPKLDYLVEMINELPAGRKLLVFHQYRETGRMIAERLLQEKIPHVMLNGGMKDSDKLRNAQSFKDDPHLRVIVMSSTGATGHNLQVANYTAFYETFESPITRAQAEKRNDRIGQERKVFQVDLVMKGTIDERLRHSNREGKNLKAEIMSGASLKGLLF